MVYSRLAGHSALAIGLLAGLGCGASLPDRDEPALLLSVISVKQGVVPPSSQQFCQVWMDVEALMPDCGIWGHHDFRREGDTFHFAFFAEYSQGACYGRGTHQDGISICIPGEGQPRIAPGAYTIVVNGVTGSFTIP